MSDYVRSEAIGRPPDQCFRALTQHISSWWSARTEGEANVEGGEFVVYFGKTFKKLKVIQLKPNRAVVWRCIESYIDLDSLTNKSEWNGTEIRWEIETSEIGVMLTVTHVGLNPSIGCYQACEQGWDHFFKNSLVPFLERGAGAPHTDVSHDA